MKEFLTTNYTPYLGVLFAIFTLFSIFATTIFIKNKKSENNRDKLILTIIKYISLVLVFLIYFVNKQLLNIVNANFVFGISLFFYIIHFELLTKYIIGGREEELLYKPFVYIKIPVQISLSCGIVFLSIWSKNFFTIVFSLIFAVLNIYVAYTYYKKNYMEYRELFDDNRNSTGKKILKGQKIPKGLNIVTVVVFMYSPKKKKGIMQKRSNLKGAKWATTSGHPKYGESSIEGMITEIKEEIGFDIKKEELTLITTFKKKDKFVDIYYIEKDLDIEKAVLQKEEVSDINYLSDRDVEKFYEAGKFKKSHYKYFNLLKEETNVKKFK